MISTILWLVFFFFQFHGWSKRHRSVAHDSPLHLHHSPEHIQNYPASSTVSGIRLVSNVILHDFFSQKNENSNENPLNRIELNWIESNRIESNSVIMMTKKDQGGFFSEFFLLLCLVGHDRRKITPALCHWLGKPAEMYMQSVARQVQAAAGFVAIADMDMIEIKLISQWEKMIFSNNYRPRNRSTIGLFCYRIFLHLSRTYSRTDSMRCVLGSLLQRMMSVASVRQRLYTLNSLLEVPYLPK